MSLLCKVGVFGLSGGLSAQFWRCPAIVNIAINPEIMETARTAHAANAKHLAVVSRSLENNIVTVTTPVATVINCLVESAARSNACFLQSGDGGAVVVGIVAIARCVIEGRTAICQDGDRSIRPVALPRVGRL